jgi:hypothetical protein
MHAQFKGACSVQLRHLSELAPAKQPCTPSASWPTALSEMGLSSCMPVPHFWHIQLPFWVRGVSRAVAMCAHVLPLLLLLLLVLPLQAIGKRASYSHAQATLRACPMFNCYTVRAS